MSNMNQQPMGQVPGPYPQQMAQGPGQYPGQMMQQRPMHPQGMQWNQQQPGGVPPRYAMGPGGQMLPVYQGQPQPGQAPNQMQPGPGGPQMYPRPPISGQGTSPMIRGPNQYPGQGPMGMQSGPYPSSAPNRMMMHPGQGMPSQQPGTGPMMQNQYGMPGSVHPQPGQGQPPPGAQYSSHPYPAPGQVDGSNADRRNVRPVAPMPPHISHHPGGMVPQQQPPPSQMGPPGPPSQQHPQHIMPPSSVIGGAHSKVTKKKKRLSDKLLTDRIQEIVPESQAYMELLQFEKKIDETIQRKRLEVQEVLKKPLKLRKKLRIFINSSFFPANVDSENPDDRTPSWELRVEGRLLDDPATGKVADPAKFRRKFSSFFKSLVIELDKNIYGPENYLVEWHRTATTQETDGFQVKRPGEQSVVCKLHFMLDYQPPQFKLDARLARLLGIHTQTRTAIIMALWQYIRTHRLQDPHERDVVICDKYLQQIFEVERIRFPDIPQAITGLLLPPEPIIVQHVVAVGPGEGQTDARRTSCYDIEVEVDDPLIGSMHQFIFNLQAQQEIAQLDSKIVETVELINKSKTAREFYTGFASDPQQFIDKWLASQCSDLKTMTDCEGNPEYDRRSSAFTSEDPTTREAVMRYFFNRVHQRRAELEQVLMNGK